MGNPWLSKKAFLYFGGAFVLLLGGVIVLMAPYHYTGYVALQGDTDAFEIWDTAGYYPQLEIAVTVTPEINESVYVDIRVINNETHVTHTMNITLSTDDMLQDTERLLYEKRQIIDLNPGNYTIFVDRIEGATDMDISFTQISDSRLYIVTGGVMNIVGLFMGAFGYCIGGSLIPTGEEAIVEWGWDEHQKPK
ncbi:MAG: hypothetical protein P1Q69_13720 [Candidatus Thorarchaeota archaeon]|nr:hypothetical protein [Candidatus Thorarchaeota archaeon]